MLKVCSMRCAPGLLRGFVWDAKAGALWPAAFRELDARRQPSLRPIEKQALDTKHMRAGCLVAVRVRLARTLALHAMPHHARGADGEHALGSVGLRKLAPCTLPPP